MTASIQLRGKISHTGSNRANKWKQTYASIIIKEQINKYILFFQSKRAAKEYNGQHSNRPAIDNSKLKSTTVYGETIINSKRNNDSMSLERPFLFIKKVAIIQKNHDTQ